MRIKLKRKKCKCGCGQLTHWNRQHKRYNIYINHHGCVGRILSEKTRLKISEGNKGPRWSDSDKKRMSKQRKGLLVGEKNGMFGKNHSEETKLGMSKDRSGSGNAMFGKKHSKESLEKMRMIKLGKKLSEKTKRKMGAWQKGENNNNWNGGSSFEPYGTEFNNKLKESVRKRDNYTCQECGIKQIELFYKLNVHHIDYDKQNNVPENLISLCSSCHAKTNIKRAFWTGYLIGLLTKRKILLT